MLALPVVGAQVKPTVDEMLGHLDKSIGQPLRRGHRCQADGRRYSERSKRSCQQSGGDRNRRGNYCEADGRRRSGRSRQQCDGDRHRRGHHREAAAAGDAAGAASEAASKAAETATAAATTAQQMQAMQRVRRAKPPAKRRRPQLPRPLLRSRRQATQRTQRAKPPAKQVLQWPIPSQAGRAAGAAAGEMLDFARKLNSGYELKGVNEGIERQLIEFAEGAMRLVRRHDSSVPPARRSKPTVRRSGCRNRGSSCRTSSRS